MSKDYKISNDGTIFEIKEDGSISKLAKINEKGRITDLSGNIMSVNVSSNSSNYSKGGYWFFIILFAIATAVLGSLYAEANDNYNWANYERIEYKNKYESASSSISSLRTEVNSLKQERDNAKKELSSLKTKVSSAYPIIITDIEIANIYADGDIQTDYGYMIYSYNTMYLKPRIKYTGISSGYKTLKIKWFTPDGTISTGTSSPYGFSQSESIYVSNGDNTYAFSGWGNSYKGYWKSGTYRIEIWYENSCLKSKSFTIY